VLDGVILLWWILTVPSFLFVALDIWRTTHESPVLKWAFVILTAFTGPIGAFFYVLGCREPLRGTHEKYVATRWRQVLGSTMHCVARRWNRHHRRGRDRRCADAVLLAGLSAEYALGFGFGWAFFQAFAMRDAAGGSYLKSLKMTFLPELLSMNLLMTGMVITSRFAMRRVDGSDDPARPQFWFVMSMALIVGFACAYPINWWLVANHMKHGMMTVRAAAPSAAAEEHSMGSGQHQPGTGVKAAMTVLTFAILGAALVIVMRFAM
jgi:hypothetical protein